MADKNNFDSVQINGVTYTAEGSKNKFLRHRESDSSSSIVPLNKELEKSKALLSEIQKQIVRIEVEQKNSAKLTNEEVEKNKKALGELRGKRKELNDQIELEEELLSKGNARIKLAQQRIEKARQESEAKKSELDFENSVLKAQQEAINTELYRYELEEGNWEQRRKNLEDEIELQQLKIMYAEDEAERTKAVNDLLKAQAKLQKHEEEHQKKIDKASMRAKAEILAKQKDENPITKLQDFFSSAKDAFNMGKEAGMSPVSALLNIKEVLISGNEDQKKRTEKLEAALASGFNAMNAMIDRAVDVVQTGYGSVTAALYGTGQTFDDIRQNLVSGAGISSLVKQEDLLKQVTSIAQEGIATDIESLAILGTIKDKTVSSFSATNDNLRRLVRLNQNLGNLSAKQFGLAAVLRTELNAAFGDSSYMAKMFQQLTGTLIDAVSMNALKGGTDSTNFYAVMETFAGGLYEAGVDEGTVSAIAQGINYLGSGNINALSGNKTLQNLLLLSMDRVGLDYATILQQGLTTDDTYLLLQSIIDYLAEITEQNKENNVLQSSYANLFNLSVTDMTAIRNLSKNNVFRNYATKSIDFNNTTAMQAAINEINAVSERTMFSEKMTNVFENAKFTLASGIASSPLALATNLIARYGVQAGNMLSDIGLTRAGKVTSLASGVAWGLSLLGGIDDLLSGIKTSFGNIGKENNTLSNYILTDFSSNGGMYDLGDTMRDFAHQGSGLKTFDAYANANNGQSYDTVQNKYLSEQETWEQEQREAEQDPNTKILKEFEKTLMKAKEGDGYAFAVSLQGMSDAVLTSFASIFTEKDDEIKIKGGKVTNNSLSQNNTFIDYASDTSSATSGGSSSTAK